MALSKITKALLASAISVASIIGSALAANAVTNPADNPHPITVTGDDGNTYHDGADTLPGYDDEECTYIPGAWFDFANNRVRYADGQSIPWTEWDRASGYREWLAAQSSSNTNPDDNNDNSSTSTSHNKSKKSSAKTESTETATDETMLTTEVVTPVDGQKAVLAASIGSESSSNPGRETGLAILGTLLLAGVVLTSGSSIRDRFARKEKA